MPVIATKQANGSFADQVFDEVVGSARKWFTLQNNVLDGTFHPIPANGSEQVGFIGAYPADANGNIQRLALNFDGVDDEVTLPGPTISGDCTVEGRFYWASGTASLIRDTTSSAGWILAWDNGGYLEYRIGGVAFKTTQAVANLKNAWHYYAMVNSGGNAAYYIDGVLIHSTTGAGTSSPVLPWHIMRNGALTGYIQGTASEIRIWNYARTQAEIQRDMNKPLKGDEPGLIGYWTMDEGSGSVVYDKTANANHGTIYGATWTQVPGASVARWKLDSPRPAHTLRVHGDTQRNLYPVDFDVQLYDVNANLVLERQIRGNTQVQWSEILPQTYAFLVMDVTVYKMSAASSVILTEASNEFSVVRKDTLLPKLVDATTLVGVSVQSADTLLSKLVDGKLPTIVSLVKADTLLPKIADSSFFRQYEFRRADTLLPETTEATLGITARLTKQDTLLPKVSEARSVTASFAKRDILSPKVIDEAWYRFGYDDSTWPLAVQTPKHTAWATISEDPDAQWVWDRPTASTTAPVGTVYFRKKFSLAAQTVVKLKYAVDNQANGVYIDGQLVSRGGGFSSVTLVTLTLNAGEHIIAIAVANLGTTDNPAGLLVSLLDSANVVIAHTDGTWKCSGYVIPASKSITASFTKQDTLLPKAVEAEKAITASFTKTDALLPKAVEAKQIQVSFIKQDTLLPKVSEVKNVTVHFAKADTVLLSPLVEIDQVTVHLARPDTLLATLAELRKLTNVHTRMDEDARTIHCKVEITYTSPFTASGDMAITVPETAHGTHFEQIADNVTQSKFKWFSLHDNKLDGSYHPIPEDRRYSVGWWSVALSDQEGKFATPVTLAVEFAEPRSVYELSVSGDSLLGNFPVDFTIRLLDASSALLYAENVIGNNNSTWYKDINDVPNVKRMELSISKISKPYQPVKITEFYTNVIETYEDDAIESIKLIEELEYPNTSVVLGNVSANEIDITLYNVNGRFNLGNTDSPLNGLLKTNRRVRVWLGVEIVPGVVEWYPLGVFWTVFWSVPDQSVWANLTARDRLELLRQTDFNTSQVYQNYTVYQLAELILHDAGLYADDYVIDPQLQQIVIPYAWFDRGSHRDALQRLAGVGMIQVYCDRQGKIHVEKTSPTPTVIYEFNDDKNLFSKDFPLVWGQVANYIEVTSIQWVPGDLQIVCDSTEVIDIPAGQDVVVTYAFSSVPIVDVQAPVITAGPDVQVYSYVAYAWGIQVTYRNNGISAEQVTRIQVTGRALQQQGSSVAVAKDDASIRDIGRIKASIQHDFIQTTAYAQFLADELLAQCKNSRQDTTLSTRGNIALKLGDRVTAPSYLQNIVSEYMVKRQEITWAGYLEASVEGQKIT